MVYITAPWGSNEFENTETAARYCRAVYDAGFSPVCPLLFLPLFLNDAIPQEHKDGIDMGEVSAGSLNGIDIEEIARDTIREIGYNDHRFGFDADTVAIITSIHGQSPDIAQGVTRALEVRDSKKQELGAGDQGIQTANNG